MNEEKMREFWILYDGYKKDEVTPYIIGSMMKSLSKRECKSHPLKSRDRKMA